MWWGVFSVSSCPYVYGVVFFILYAFLGCLVNRMSDNYLGIGFDMAIRRRVFGHGLRRL